MPSTRSPLLAIAVFVSLAAGGCAVDRVNPGGGGGTGGSAAAGGSGGGSGGRGGAVGTGAGGTGGTIVRDACHVDSDCPPIECLVAPCPQVVCVLADGVHVCLARPIPAPVTCPTATPGDASCCRSDLDCTAQANGHCVPNSFGACGGPAPVPGNTCRYDACTGDADCAGGFCSANSPRACISGPCRTNADCTRRPGGVCEMRGVGRFCPQTEVFCRYAGDCALDGDCTGDAGAFGLQCVPNADLQGTTCQPVPPPPP